MQAPQTLRRGKGCFSINATDHPAEASKIAAVPPAGPAPTTMASYSVFTTALAAPQQTCAKKAARPFHPVAIRHAGASTPKAPGREIRRAR